MEFRYMEFKFLSFIDVKGFWNVEALSLRYILENVIPNILPDVLHICIIFNALPHVTIKFLRKQFSRSGLCWDCTK